MNSGASVPAAALAALSRLDGADRLYSLDFERPPGAFGGGLVVDRWHGWEALSEGFEWLVDLLSVDARLPLDGLVGQRATLWTRAADGSRIPRSGLVREAACIGSDGGLARYRVSLVPWTWLLTQGRHSRVYQDRGVVGIIESVFDAYAPYAAWQVGDEVGPFLDGARPRSYCVQYRETDFDFVSRLLAEEGLAWRIEEAEEAAGGHRLVLFAGSGDGPQDATAEAGGGVRFHRSDATEATDSIQALGRPVGIGATALTLLSHDYKGGALGASIPLGNAADTAAALEVYDPAGAYAFADHAEAARYAGLMADAEAARRDGWLGRSTVRSFRAGRWLAVRAGVTELGGGTPDELLLVAVQQAGINNLPDAVRDVLPLMPEASMALPGTLSRAAWSAVWARAEAVGYGNAFTAVPRALDWRPVLVDDTGLRMNPRPTAPGYQTAVVVGEGGELHSDALGRVRVRFHFQRDAGGAAASDSCWLRVSQRYAGPGVGSQFLPRIGQEVLVGFLDGDIDRPIVLASLYNGQGEAGIAPTPGGEGGDDDTARLYADARDHRPSAQGNLAGGHAPAWHGMSGDADGHRNPAALSGFKSKEFFGPGHNRLVFDDSDGQLRLQLATTHAASELNLGHLVHQADNFRGSFRGEGFELRTDQWGAVRGQRGLWVSAYGNGPDAPAGEHVAATALLKQATQLGQSFSDIAGTHLTVKLAAHQGAAKANQSTLIGDQSPLAALHASAATTVDGASYPEAEADAPQRSTAAGADRVPHSGDALLGLSAPAGIGLVAGQSLHWSTGETLTVASGADSNLAIAGDLRIHAGQAIGWLAGAVEGGVTAAHALALVTAEGELRLEAQNDVLKLQSKDPLKVISANGEVELAAGKTVHLATEGGASITIEGGNISVACPGNITVHAGKKSFVGGAEEEYPLPEFPGSVCVECMLKAQVQGAPLAAKNG
ncbi:type IV secretion protein Rhs [Lysobacter arseniciresistens ZS79]|uniref:Type IV secretion protein Rhs n=1 Tax=Lysobacter arseniciresistens ZS79 TaxID=913325 RepID=A0A0A0F054_9GAMM|nr:type VI secretion system Vgr family protein [Lysobacter arseniciresistens]KGM56566.1 type IV secretion protein Rhs [Lysobacter arseniciresistens ZS79]